MKYWKYYKNICSFQIYEAFLDPPKLLSDIMDRKFKKCKPKICYDRPPSCLVNKAEYDKRRNDALNGKLVDSLIVPKKSARTWTMQKGDLCKITLIEGSQVSLTEIKSIFKSYRSVN